MKCLWCLLRMRAQLCIQGSFVIVMQGRMETTYPLENASGPRADRLWACVGHMAGASHAVRGRCFSSSTWIFWRSSCLITFLSFRFFSSWAVHHWAPLTPKYSPSKSLSLLKIALCFCLYDLISIINKLPFSSLQIFLLFQGFQSEFDCLCLHV